MSRILATFLLCTLLLTLPCETKAADEPVEVYVWAEQPTSAATEQTRWQKDLELRTGPARRPKCFCRVYLYLSLSTSKVGL